jgi:carboxymethylenebutenolidase
MQTAIASASVDVSVDDQDMAMFVARPPAQPGVQYPGIVVAYEAFGMTDYIRDVATKLAGAGYVAVVPDLYHRVGRLLSVPYGEYSPAAQADRATPLDSRRLMATLDDAQATRDLGAGLNYLAGQPDVHSDRLGVLGFWNGGRLAYLLACRNPDLKAVVSFYGHIGKEPVSEKRPDSLLDLTDRLQAPVLLIWGKDGQPITLAEVHELEERLRSNGKQFESKVYDVPRGFHNPNVVMYDAPAAGDAWQRASAWFQTHLKT